MITAALYRTSQKYNGKSIVHINSLNRRSNGLARAHLQAAQFICVFDEVIILLIWDMLYKCELHVLLPLPKNVLHFSCGGYVCVGMCVEHIHKMCNRLKGLLVINTVTKGMGGVL